MIDQALGLQPVTRRKSRENGSETYLFYDLDHHPNQKSAGQTRKPLREAESIDPQ